MMGVNDKNPIIFQGYSYSELHQIVTMYERIMSLVYHDGNDALSSLILNHGLIEIEMRKHPEEGMPFQDRLRAMDRAMARLESIMKDARELTRTLTRSRTQTETAYPVEEIVDIAVDYCFPDGYGDDLRITGTFPKVKVQPFFLRQILVNLIRNAQKYRHPEKELNLQLDGYVQDDVFLLTLRDNGIGMTQEIKDRIFEPFFQASEHHQGFGLGLPIIRDIVEGYQGHIWAESSGPGMGAVFRLALKAD